MGCRSSSHGAHGGRQPWWSRVGIPCRGRRRAGRQMVRAGHRDRIRDRSRDRVGSRARRLAILALERGDVDDASDHTAEARRIIDDLRGYSLSVISFAAAARVRLVRAIRPSARGYRGGDVGPGSPTRCPRSPCRRRSCSLGAPWASGTRPWRNLSWPMPTRSSGTGLSSGCGWISCRRRARSSPSSRPRACPPHPGGGSPPAAPDHPPVLQGDRRPAVRLAPHGEDAGDLDLPEARRHVARRGGRRGSPDRTAHVWAQ